MPVQFLGLLGYQRHIGLVRSQPCIAIGEHGALVAVKESQDGIDDIILGIKQCFSIVLYIGISKAIQQPCRTFLGRVRHGFDGTIQLRNERQSCILHPQPAQIRRFLLQSVLDLLGQFHWSGGRICIRHIEEVLGEIA